MTRLHLAVAVFLGLVLPAYSWINGSGWLAWTMFATSSTYRIAVRVTDAAGATHVVNPTELARFAQGDSATYLSGADHFRHAPVASSLRAKSPWNREPRLPNGPKRTSDMDTTRSPGYTRFSGGGE